MRGSIIKTFILGLVLAAFVTEALADSLRCGRKLIKTGDSSAELLRVCGKPFHKDRGVERIKVNGAVKEANVQRWHYKKSSRSLERIVMVYKGKVSGIETGSR